MKQFLIMPLLCLFASCSQLFYSDTQSNQEMIADLNKDLELKGRSTVGRTKNELLLNWGPPSSKTSDGNNGEIYTYTVSAPFSFGTYTGITNLYINEKGVIYHSNFKYLLQ